MKIRLQRFRRFTPKLAVFVTILSMVGTAWAEQPKMEKAVDLLQRAKQAQNPMPLLKEAKERVQNAKHNKGGRRQDAIEAITEAIKVAESGENPEAKINHAIAMIHSGKDRAK